MAVAISTGVFNHLTNQIEPPNAGDWTDLGTTWNEVNTWNPTATTFTWVSDVVALSESGLVNIVVETSAQGTVEYTVYSSDTGAFDGEETSTSVSQGDTGVSAFDGKYFYVVATVTNTNSLPILESQLITTKSKSGTTLRLSGVDTSTLTGTVDARTLDFGRTTSGIRNLQITVREVTDFTLESYVTDYPTSNTLIPRIVSTTAGTIALVGLDNVARDGVIDVVAEILPEQYMDGNNLRVR